MDTIKIINSDQIGLSSYNKMEEENASPQNVSPGAVQNLPSNTRFCKWPHQWTLSECCCGCNVRIGSLFIGWLFLLLSSILLFCSVIGPLPSFLRWEDVLFTSIKFISSLLLLIGIYKHKLRLIRISVILSLIDVAVDLVVSIVLSVIIGNPLPLIVVVFFLPLSFYFLVVVNSLGNQMAMGLISPPRLVAV